MLKTRFVRGVTLVELMVGLAIFAFLLMLGAPSFSTWIQNGQIRTATEAIQSGLQLARAEAVRRNMPVRFQLTDTLTNGCTLSDTGKNWVVSMDDPTGACGAAPSADLAIPVAPRILQVRSAGEGSANAVIEAMQGTITFNGLGRVTPVPAGGPLPFLVTNPTGGTCSEVNGPMRCLQVIVSPAGQIRLCDPRFAATDSQGC
jgi:type IV fimbrial biogenesis protein FimT